MGWFSASVSKPVATTNQSGSGVNTSANKSTVTNIQYNYDYEVTSDSNNNPVSYVTTSSRNDGGNNSQLPLAAAVVVAAVILGWRR